ncbi:polyubiquitin binding protein, putative [Plasmodium chabaudi adami]|uniref:Polyubiquitin binding protein, putative n=1 Tax=Plasmodium chabaudi adami TaxID=5826 RepID=A0A1D3RZ20_PLACE|nr:polyubiquitin binding protein, putative [Plasmodium chabaudi adami]
MQEDKEYELRGILKGHCKGVRCLCVINNKTIEELNKFEINFEYIVSADLNGIIIVWKKEAKCNDKVPNDDQYNDNFILYKKIEVHEKFIYALCYSKYVGISELKNNSNESIEDNLHFYSGGNDKNIYLLNLNGLIELVLQGHTNSICSIVEKDENILLSADWNGEVFVWKIEKSNPDNIGTSMINDGNAGISPQNINSLSSNKYTYTILKVLKNHKHATYITCFNDIFFTISQNNIVNMWNKEGEKIDEIKNIHSDTVRDIILFNDNKNIITFSNDENIHIYDSNFNLIKIYMGHTGFVFYVCVNEKDKLMYSCSDDKTIKIWSIEDVYKLMENYDINNIKNNPLMNNNNSSNKKNDNFGCLQTIHLKNTLWNIKLLHNDDIVSACNDNYIRIFTNKKEHKLNKEIAEGIENELNKNNDKDNLHSNKDINSVENMKNIIGKIGEIKIFKNQNKYEAYKYETNGWVLIGDVVDDANSSKKFYIGDNLFQQGYYDEIFSIDTGYGDIKQLPYNINDNINLIAEKFCKRESISITHIKSIVDFINQNCSNLNKNNSNQNINMINEDTKKFVTVLNVFTIQAASLDKILQKIKEFNVNIPANEQNSYKLSDNELNSLTNITNIYKKSIKNDYIFNTADINLITKLCNWQPVHIFPVIDLFRVLILNKHSDILFNNKYSFNAFKLVYDCILYYFQNKNDKDKNLDPLLVCCLRFYLNMFNLSTPRYYMFKKCNLILKQFANFKSNNLNINTLLIKIFFNFVISLNENNDNEIRKTLFQSIHEFRENINEIELLYTYSLCFHTSYSTYQKQTQDIIQKYDIKQFIKDKLKSLTTQKNEQNEKLFKNVNLILNDLP